MDALVARLRPVLDARDRSWEMVFIDDGSRDGTLARIRSLNAGDPRMRAVAFSRNFGKEIAIAAGLDHARGRRGRHHGRRSAASAGDDRRPSSRNGARATPWSTACAPTVAADGPVRRGGSRACSIGSSPLRRDAACPRRRRFPAARPPGGGRAAADGRARAFHQGPLRLDRLPVDRRALRRRGAHAGRHKFSSRKLFRFAFDGITSFSTLPLKLWTYVGAVRVGLLADHRDLSWSQTMMRGVDVPGYASLIVSVMFLAGVQLHLAGRHRRIYRPHFRRGEAPPALHRRRAGSASRSPRPWRRPRVRSAIDRRRA